VVSATRSSRTIANIPTRVEVISGEELDEKSNMKPGDIRMVLAESTGIQTQQTSATSGNSSIRIQGLDGKYTQIIRDGFPLYSGFSGGLGLLQVAPLDLKQVEVIKGSSSTLYGGGAIAGLVNLVSKTH
jgi:outer membrane receptor for ferrienterochelin and colicins